MEALHMVTIYTVV